MCPNNYYVDGAQVKFEDSQGKGDDTALNGLKIHCQSESSSSASQWVIVWEGSWGNWKTAVTRSDLYVKLAKPALKAPRVNVMIRH